VTYLKDPSGGAERNIQRLAFKCVLVDDEFYHRTTKDLLLKCLDSVWAEVERFLKESADCGTHQSAPKMKWLLRRDSLLPTRVGREIGSLHDKREFH
jgi:hypothetical protein